MRTHLRPERAPWTIRVHPSRFESPVAPRYALAIAAAALIACGGRHGADESSEPADAGAQSDAAIVDFGGHVVGDAGAHAFACDVVLGVMVCHGTLDPTTLGAGIKPVGRATQPAQHYYCRPKSRAPNGRMLLHLVDRGDSPTRLHRFALHACALGFAAIVPAYENGGDIRAQCGANDACSIAAHTAVLYDGDDALANRVRTLLDALAAKDAAFAPWSSWRDRWALHDTASMAVSGHGRGADHALFLAKAFAFERAVLLAGPTERVAWIDSYVADGGRTSNVLGYVDGDDTVSLYANVRAGWTSLGIEPATCTFTNGPCAPDCRGVVTASAGCNGYYAHLSVAVEMFGANCAPGVGPSTNDNTWGHLLDAP